MGAADLLRVTDNATTELITTETDYVLQVDPTGDIPDTTIVYPDPTIPSVTLGGNIRISGTAEDDDGVAGVYMQIDVDGDGASARTTSRQTERTGTKAVRASLSTAR